ncbi:hypothetical protein RDI58_000618 [Solanum bulbocastanum]|uniref:Reverse transcriptase Ty1/copia-type domain-containing protein n=1 Tax=Solanum bulbocastanum TaxID=147425 RepID=A0AAN8U3F6_SOLBU
MSNDKAELDALKLFLDSEFKIKDLGDLYYFLGIEVMREPQGLILNQRKFVLEFFSEYNCLGLKPTSSPLDPTHKQQANMGSPLPDATVYRRLIGQLNFLTHTRPDISFSVHTLANICNNLIRHIFQLHIMFFVISFQIQAFCDSNCATCPDSHWSVSSFYISLGGSPISLEIEKQTYISLSSVEAEYRSMRRVVA